MSWRTDTFDTVELELYLHSETERAVLVSEDGDAGNSVWLPKSQIEVDHDEDGFVLVTIPEWLARKKDLI